MAAASHAGHVTRRPGRGCRTVVTHCFSKMKHNIPMPLPVADESKRARCSCIDQLVYRQFFREKRGGFCARIPLSLHHPNGNLCCILGRTGSSKTVLLTEAISMFPGDTSSILLDGTTDIPGTYLPLRKLGLMCVGLWPVPHMKVKEKYFLPD